MTDLLLLALGASLVNNFVLTQFLGLCPFVGVSRRLEAAAGMALATLFVLTLSSGASYAAWHWLLEPLGLGYLRTIVFILLIAAAVQATEMLVRASSPLLHELLGVFLPLIAVNCAILGGSLFMQEREYANIGEATVFGLGSGVGWFLAIVGIAAIREKIKYSNVPAPLRGLGITFIITGLMGIAFMSFMGIKL